MNKLSNKTIGLLVVLSCVSSCCFGQGAVEDLRSELNVFNAFIGTWEIDGAWKSGEKIWARSEYQVGMRGNFVEAKTFAKDGDGEPYQRYMTIWRWDQEQQKVISHGFTYDGSYTELETEVSMVDGKETIESKWDSNGVTIRQVVQKQDANSYSWQVFTINDDVESQVMDGVWNRKN